MIQVVVFVVLVFAVPWRAPQPSLSDCVIRRVWDRCSTAPRAILPTILAHLSLNVTLGVGGAALSSDVLWWTTAVAYALITWVVFPRTAEREPVVVTPEFVAS